MIPCKWCSDKASKQGAEDTLCPDRQARIAFGERALGKLDSSRNFTQNALAFFSSIPPSSEKTQ